MTGLSPRRRPDERGAALLIVLGVLFALSLIGLAALRTTDTELSIAGNRARKSQALLAAEAGLARAQYVFRQNPHLTSAEALSALINSDTALPNAAFHVAMDTSLPRRRVIAVGAAGAARSGVQVTYIHGCDPRNVWNNALFAGHGDGGIALRGQTGVHGSMHILGDGEPYSDQNGNGTWDPGEPFTDANHDGQWDAPLHPDSMALDLSGTPALRNHYGEPPAVFAPRLPALATTTYRGETVFSLAAELRVKHGKVALSGNAKIGAPNVTGGTPPVKETFDATWVTDGYTGTTAEEAVCSDNGFRNPYDLDDGQVIMPCLDLPCTDEYGTHYASYLDYLRARALVVPGNLTLAAGTALPLQASGNGSLYMDGTGHLQGSGVIYVEGDIHVQDAGAIVYDGRFTFVSEGDVVVDADLLPMDVFASDDALGVVSHGKIRLGTNESAPRIMAALFAQEELHVVDREVTLAGAAVANSIRLDRVLRAYQVPALIDHMPPGMPGAAAPGGYAWRLLPRSWVELD